MTRIYLNNDETALTGILADLVELWRRVSDVCGGTWGQLVNLNEWRSHSERMSEYGGVGGNLLTTMYTTTTMYARTEIRKP